MDNVGDKVYLKKSHPCGNNEFTVIRTGADVKLQCVKCGHTILLTSVQYKKAKKDRK